MNRPSHRPRFLLLALALSAFTPGCFNFEKKEEGDGRPLRKVETIDTRNQTDFLIGTIEHVNPQHEFVLIHAIVQPAFEPGETLEVRRDLLTVAQLVPSGERKGHHLAADILEGDPQVGDTVALNRKSLQEIQKPKMNIFARAKQRSEARKQSRQLRKAAEQRRELEKANSWSAQ